jgi:hypothetical protein
MDTDAQVAQYFAGIWAHLDEHARRLVAASKAVELGYGGISRVSRACGLSRVTLTKESIKIRALSRGQSRSQGGEDKMGLRWPSLRWFGSTNSRLCSGE